MRSMIFSLTVADHCFFIFAGALEQYESFTPLSGAGVFAVPSHTFCGFSVCPAQYE